MKLLVYWLGAQGYGVRFVGPGLLDCARDTAAGFDLDLSIRDRAGNMTASTDQEPLPYDEIALEAATHIGVLRGGMAVEDPGFSDDHVLTSLQCRLNRPFHNQTVAGINLTR
jgi:hypothetical protein